jgi:hypothetical protein
MKRRLTNPNRRTKLTFARRRLGRHTPVPPPPVSSHPEIEEEIEQANGALDRTQLERDAAPRKPKAIVSVDGCDVKEDCPPGHNKAA